MQIKTTLIFHLAPVRIEPRSRKQAMTNAWEGVGKRGTRSPSVGWKTSRGTLEMGVKRSQEAKRKFPVWPGYTTLWYGPRGLGTLLHRHLLSPLHCCSFHNSQEMEKTQMSFSWWMDRRESVTWRDGETRSIREGINRTRVLWERKWEKQPWHAPWE